MTVKRAGTYIAMAAIGLFAAANVHAVDGPVVGHVSFGPSMPQGDSGDFLEDGWALHGGATWFSSSRPNLGLRLDLGVDWFDMKQSLLDTIDTDTGAGSPGIQPPDEGYARAWSATVDVMWNSNSKGTVGWYVVGGAGFYYAQADLSEYGVTSGWYCDPWWGVCYPGVGTGEYIIESESNWEWGLNAGAGITFKTGPSAEIYVEAIYHWVDTKNGAEFIPVTVGVRW